MSHILDDIARIIASPMPRRRALQLLGATLAGGIFGSLGVRPIAAQQGNQGNQNNQGNQDNQGNKSKNNCGSTNCSKNQVCCNVSPYKAFCATSGKTCCGNTAGDGNHVCCKTGSQPFLATRGKTCCGNTSCASGQICCTTCSKPFCASKGHTCCGSTTCSSKQFCCNNTVCCDDQQSCVNGRCKASRS